jgi:hypothetical protein
MCDPAIDVLASAHCSHRSFVPKYATPRVGSIDRIDRVHTGRPDANDHTPCARRRPRELRRLEVLSRPRSTNDNGTHVAREATSELGQDRARRRPARIRPGLAGPRRSAQGWSMNGAERSQPARTSGKSELKLPAAHAGWLTGVGASATVTERFRVGHPVPS